MRSLLVAVVTVSTAALAGPSLEEQAKALFKPLPKDYETKDAPVMKERVALGRLLYFDVRLSKNHDVSCNSCHDLAKFGVDGEALSSGHKKQKGSRNSPTVYNAGNHLAQFWDGRAPTLEEQAKGPILNPVEMAMKDEASAVAVLESVPGYLPLFKKAFPGQDKPITWDNLARAIGAFERTLVTPSRFDRYLAGDAKALTDAEKAGLEKFVSAGCTACHLGEGLGGGMYQKLGLVKAVPNLKDTGRFDATKKDADKFFFKVPTLRNIEKTGPYLHDGSLKTLEEAVTFMGTYQLGKDLKKEEVDSIIVFLKALTGELPKDVKAPKPLASGKTTPKADPT
ncbi:MAG: cytochrome-c peroxidase [Myxococcales bacterium]|nr:cytochrome-c peroxidase [Myxococcales bacterium]